MIKKLYGGPQFRAMLGFHVSEAANKPHMTGSPVCSSKIGESNWVSGRGGDADGVSDNRAKTWTLKEHHFSKDLIKICP